MTNFLQMTPLDAVKWFDKNRAAIGYGDPVESIERLLGLGVTDTELLIEFGGGVLDDLDAVPGMEPTAENLRNLLTVGPTVMREDAENVSDWLGLVDHPAVGNDPHQTFAEFIAAKRGPAFARQVLDLIDRKTSGYFDLSDVDLTLPYSEIVDMADAEVSAAVRRNWKKAGFELADTIALRDSGLDLKRIAVLQHHGAPREQWAKYVPIPIHWLDQGFGVSKPRELPEGFDLDLLLTLTDKGWTDARIETPGRRARVDVAPWEVYCPIGAEVLTRQQAQRLLDANLTNMTATKYYTESRSGVGAETRKAPGPLLTWAPGQDPDLDTLIGQWIELAKAGVRPSHLSEYRWAGCTSYRQILDALAAGITPKRAKELRARHGVKTGYQVNDTKRIASYDALLAHHQGDEENNSAVRRPDERA